MKTLDRHWILGLLVAIAGSLASAGPLPASLSVTGQVSFDTVNSFANGGALQSGTLTHRNGGVDTTLAFGVAPNLLSGALSATGDGAGVLSSVSGTFAGPDPATVSLFADYLFNLSNSSATDTLTIFFRATAINNVSASGADAYAHSLLSVRDELNAEIFFSDISADTVNGDTSFISASDLFSLVLAPGQSTSFSALQSLQGGAFADGSSYSASLDGFLAIEEVRSTGTPTNDVPLPGTLPLVLLALLMARRTRRV
ncbi:MAG TPA: hypothetical protein VGE47_05460 [Burkholderiaceae bacterium]